ncbi:MAG: DUF5667 domain-containing protein [Anaerolineae bacterium]|jgi:hypothetical protein
MKHDEIDRELAEALDSLREVPLPDEGRQAAHRAAFLAGARAQHGLTESEAGSRRWLGFLRPAPVFSKKWALAGVAVAIVLALLVSTGGVIYAADAAVPGDPLYGVDQAVESARLGLTHRPESVMNLLLSLAEERLLEAEELAAQQDEGNLGVVLDNYGATVSALAQTLGTVEGADRATLTALLDQAFSDHDLRLTNILGPAVVADAADDGEEEATEDEDAAYCVGADPHPTAQRLADTYDVTYEEIMGWFCDDGYGLGEIKHALETSVATGDSPEDLLALKNELGGWGEVWQELGLIGSTDDDSEEFTEEEEEELAYCVGVEPHPVAQRLAETYGVAYEDIMTWFCEGRYGLGEIMHALQTSDDEDGNAPDQVLLRKTELGGWGQVWQELGLIGKPDDKPDKDAKEKPAKPMKAPKVKPTKKPKPEK